MKYYRVMCENNFFLLEEQPTKRISIVGWRCGPEDKKHGEIRSQPYLESQ